MKISALGRLMEMEYTHNFISTLFLFLVGGDVGGFKHPIKEWDLPMI
jgi:hypothetical protein